MSRERFENELNNLAGEAVELGRQVEADLDVMVEALGTSGAELSEGGWKRSVFLRERQAQLEQQCVILQVRHAPVAGDLRLVHAIRSVIDHLVRAGVLREQALQAIAEATSRERDTGLEITLIRMAQATRDIFSKALSGFERRDAEQIRELESADDEIDLHYSEIIGVLADPDEANAEAKLGSPEWRLQAALMAHYLERIADHGVGVAERTHFIVTGE